MEETKEEKKRRKIVTLPINIIKYIIILSIIVNFFSGKMISVIVGVFYIGMIEYSLLLIKQELLKDK